RLIADGHIKPGDKITILGASYKADVDDPRESPAEILLHAATSKGYNVQIHDPCCEEGDHHGIVTTRNLEAALKGSKAAILLTDHKAYRMLSSKVFADNMAQKVIYDG